MRRLHFAIVALMCISMGLVPFNTLHAHIGIDHEHAVLHGGHIHDQIADQGQTGLHEGDLTISTAIELADNGKSLSWLHWLPLVWAFALLSLLAPALQQIFRPPAADLRPVYRRACKRPPLRGPPLLSI